MNSLYYVDYTGNGHNADGEQPERYASMRDAIQKAEADARCFTGHPDFKGGQFRVWLTREESDWLVFATEVIT